MIALESIADRMQTLLGQRYFNIAGVNARGEFASQKNLTAKILRTTSLVKPDLLEIVESLESGFGALTISFVDEYIALHQYHYFYMENRIHFVDSIEQSLGE